MNGWGFWDLRRPVTGSCLVALWDLWSWFRNRRPRCAISAPTGLFQYLLALFCSFARSHQQQPVQTSYKYRGSFDLRSTSGHYTRKIFIISIALRVLTFFSRFTGSTFDMFPFSSKQVYPIRTTPEKAGIPSLCRLS